MFDFLKPNKVELTISLDRPLGPYYPGDAVHAKITVKAQKDLKIQEGRIALVCRERYKVRSEETDTDSDGTTSTSYKTEWNSDEQEIARDVILPEGTVAGNTPKMFDFSATIPQGAPPSWKGGSIVELTWVVKVTLDRKLASDFNAEAEALVPSVAPLQASAAGEYGHSTSASDCALALALPGREWLLGQTIEGKLLVRPQKDLDIKEIRVELQCIENVPADKGNSNTSSRQAKLATNVKLQTGKDGEYSFQITVPNLAPTSGKTSHASVSWLLRGVLTRGLLRSDVAVEQEVLVYSGRGS